MKYTLACGGHREYVLKSLGRSPSHRHSPPQQSPLFLGNQVVCHSIPIRPGRNVAIICESAAVNHRQNSMGYNAELELYNRVTNNLAEKRIEL